MASALDMCSIFPDHTELLSFRNKLSYFWNPSAVLSLHFSSHIAGTGLSLLANEILLLWSIKAHWFTIHEDLLLFLSLLFFFFFDTSVAYAG